MGRWEESVVTRQGEDMLNDLLFGRRLVITGAYGGTGEVDPEGLADLEDLSGNRHKLALLDVENALEGKTFGVQISNQGIESGFILHQIGIFARVDDGDERLLCVFQDRDDPEVKKRGGIDVPSQSESPSFMLEFYGFVAITNGVKFEVELSQSGAVVTPQYLAQVMENHNKDESAHPAIWAAIGKLQSTAAETGDDPPSPEMPGKPGQHYFDQSDSGEYICVGTDENGAVWVRVGAWAVEQARMLLADHNSDPEAHQDIRNSLPWEADVSIPKEGWTESGLSQSKYGYAVEVPVEGVTESMVPLGSIHPEDLDTALFCGLCPSVESLDGALRFYSQAVPAEAVRLSMVMLLCRASCEGEGAIPMPIAAADRVGGVKVQPGSGLTVDAQGNLTLEVADSNEVAHLFTGPKVNPS